MSALVSVQSISKAYGTVVLFDQLSCTLCQGDRIGLIGPNGAGKSTLLKIIADIEPPDTGTISKRQGLRVGYASQAPEFPELSIESILLEAALPGEGPLERQTRARILLGKARFTDFSAPASSLSGGWKKRLDIVRALMQEPDILLLDEPTNHLDIEGILWLEQFLARERISYVVVSHDRYFLETVSNTVVELNRCYPQGLFISKGPMSTFMERREAFLEAQAQQERGLASQVRGEVEWLKRSPKARTTKSRSRIQKAYEQIEELAELKQRNRTTRVRVEFVASERETRKLLATKNLTKALGGKGLFKGIDLTLAPGSRLGIVGKNGTGKTTLLKILAGMIPQDAGTIKYADNLRLVYFDQHREQLPLDCTLREALSPSGDTVLYRGQPIHVHGWAKKFLFHQDRLGLPIKYLSGGERARILIARLMLEPADILFLDEPTNDLDIPTLEVMEDSLKEFAGAVVLISHDRCLMDRLCTQILGLGEGHEQQFFAEYAQWAAACTQPPAPRESRTIEQPTKPRSDKSNRLSYNEQRELAGMEDAILEVEAEIAAIQQQLAQANTPDSTHLYTSLAEAQRRHEALFERWNLLDERRHV